MLDRCFCYSARMDVFCSGLLLAFFLFPTRTPSTMDTFSLYLALWIMMLIKMGQTKSTIFRCPLFIVFPCIWNIYLAFYLQCLIILPVLLRFRMLPESHYSWSPLPLPPSPFATTVPSHLYISTGLNIRKVFDKIQIYTHYTYIHSLTHSFRHCTYTIQTCKCLHTKMKTAKFSRHTNTHECFCVLCVCEYECVLYAAISEATNSTDAYTHTLDKICTPDNTTCHLQW